MAELKYNLDFLLEKKRQEDEYIRKLAEPDFGGIRPLHCRKPQKELEISDFAKVIRPDVKEKTLYARIPIRRKDPVRILTDGEIESDEDLEKRIRAIVQWFRDMEPGHNIVIDFGFQALTDEEMDELESE